MSGLGFKLSKLELKVDRIITEEEFLIFINLFEKRTTINFSTFKSLISIHGQINTNEEMHSSTRFEIDKLYLLFSLK